MLFSCFNRFLIFNYKNMGNDAPTECGGGMGVVHRTEELQVDVDQEKVSELNIRELRLELWQRKLVEEKAAEKRLEEAQARLKEAELRLAGATGEHEGRWQALLTDFSLVWGVVWKVLGNRHALDLSFDLSEEQPAFLNEEEVQFNITSVSYGGDLYVKGKKEGEETDYWVKDGKMLKPLVVSKEAFLKAANAVAEDGDREVSRLKRELGFK